MLIRRLVASVDGVAGGGVLLLYRRRRATVSPRAALCWAVPWTAWDDDPHCRGPGKVPGLASFFADAFPFFTWLRLRNTLH